MTTKTTSTYYLKYNHRIQKNMRFLTLDQIISEKGEFLLYDLFDSMGFSKLKNYVCCDGRPVCLESDAPELTPDEIVLLEMISYHFYKNYPKTWMTFHSKNICNQIPDDDGDDDDVSQF